MAPGLRWSCPSRCEGTAEFMELGAGGWDSSQLRVLEAEKQGTPAGTSCLPLFLFIQPGPQHTGWCCPHSGQSFLPLLQSQHGSHFQLHQLFCLVPPTGGEYNIPKPEKTQVLPRRLGKGHLGFAIKRGLGKDGLVGSCVCCDITSSAFIKRQA